MSKSFINLEFSCSELLKSIIHFRYSIEMLGYTVKRKSQTNNSRKRKGDPVYRLRAIKKFKKTQIQNEIKELTRRAIQNDNRKSVMDYRNEQ